MSGRYILVKQKVVPCPDLFEWGRWMQDRVKHVGDITKKGVRVSTVFLGLDHNYIDGREPLLFETMIFANKGELQRRYSTMNQAREGHRTAIKFVRRLTKCPIRKKYRKNHSSRIIGTHATLVISDQLCSSPDHKPTIPTFAAPVISELLKPSIPINGKSANE